MDDNKLAEGSLTIGESIIMGVSGTSPSYSAAATSAGNTPKNKGIKK